jgi:hypothetical protein
MGKALVLSCLVASVCSSVSSAEPRKKRAPEGPSVVPYQKGKVYRVKLLPEAPFLLELPEGETARNVWDGEGKWWKAEAVPGSPVVILMASASEDAEGRVSFLHVETEPSRLRISFRVEIVAENTWPVPPAGLEIYLSEGSQVSVASRQAEAAVGRQLPYMQKFASEKALSDFAQWRRQLIANMRDNYEWGGDFRVDRVVDDRVQTFVTVNNATDKAIIQFVPRGGGKPEAVNFELENGTYVIQNRVLNPGEKFRLTIGKQQAWVALK